MYKTILVPVDGSEHAMRATKEATRIARADATIELLYVADAEKARQEMLHASSADALLLARRQLLAPFEAYVQQASIAVKTTILKGDPGPIIVDYANAHTVDVVVIGSRGLNVLQQMVLGSVSHKVMKRVQCPVLVVK